MSFWAIFLVLHFASLICGNPLFGCYKGGEHPNIYIYMYVYVYVICICICYMYMIMYKIKYMV